jgi:PAS domain-containing protein
VPGDSHRENRAELAEVRAQLRELQEMTGAMNEGAATVSAGGVILGANPRLGSMTHQSVSDLIGTPALDLIAEAHRPAFARLILTDLTAKRAAESQAAKAREAMRERNAFLGQAREALGLGWWDAGATFYFTLDPQDSAG